MKKNNGQVLVEYILLSVLVLGATIVVLRFIVHELFGESLPALTKKTSHCVSTSSSKGQPCQ